MSRAEDFYFGELALRMTRRAFLERVRWLDTVEAVSA